MKKVILIHIVQLFVLFVFLFIFKSLGYTFATNFANPAVYFYFIIPVAVVTFFLPISIIIFTKNEKMNWMKKILLSITSFYITALIGASIWIYMNFGISLQILMYSIAIVLVVAEITIVVVQKFTRVKQ